MFSSHGIYGPATQTFQVRNFISYHNRNVGPPGPPALNPANRAPRAVAPHRRGFSLATVIVLLKKTGPRCISFRCKITVSLAQGAVNDAEADVADPVFVRSTIRPPITPCARLTLWLTVARLLYSQVHMRAVLYQGLCHAVCNYPVPGHPTSVA